MSNNLLDSSGNADLYNGSNNYFVNDRFCTPNSAVYLKTGSLQAPPGVYFSGDFSILVWINLKSYSLWLRIIEFGNGAGMEIVDLGMLGYGPRLFAEIFGATQTSLSTTMSIQLSQWYQVAFVLQGTNAYYYVNGVLQATGSFTVPNNVERFSNFIGK